MKNKVLSNIYAPNRPLTFWLISLFLVISTIAIYAQVRHHDFINHDDGIYVKDNRHVQAGLTSESIRWAFSVTKNDERAYWHPLTWLSHMLDCRIFGVDPGYHHLSNLFYHLVNVLLLFLVLTRMTGAIWKSAFVAALFAVHPLNVDSVAWLAERKNLLSTTFWFLTMLAYVYYAKKPTLRRYFLVFAGMLAGLLAKPMLVTLPCVLLLMDFWPLNRTTFAWQRKTENKQFPGASLPQIILEKIPLLALSAISTILSSISLDHGDQFIDPTRVPMGLRIENAIVSYIRYMAKIIWPHDMTIFYPFPDAIPTWQVAGALLLLMAIFTAAFLLIRKMPSVTVGWLWFTGTLVPVIGLVQGGRWPAIADRWTYVPAIGLFIIAGWGGAAILKKISPKKILNAVCAAFAIIPLMIISHHQAGYWKNSITLFSHAIDVTKDNGLAHYNLGQALGDTGDFEKAIIQYNKALKIDPQNANAHINLANALARKGEYDDAFSHFNMALRIAPDDEVAHLNLAKALLLNGKPDEAASHFNAALKINPRLDHAYVGLGNIFATKGDINQAIEYTLNALKINSHNAVAADNLGKLMLQQGNIAGAVQYFKKTLEIDPANESAKANLNQLSIIQKKINEQAPEILQAIQSAPNDPAPYVQLGRLYQSAGFYTLAIPQYEKALSIKPATIPALYSLGVIYTLRGEYDHAIEAFKKIIANDPDNAAAFYNIACIYSRQDRKSDAVEWLKKAVDKGYNNTDNLRADPDLDKIREEPGYRELIERIRSKMPK